MKYIVSLNNVLIIFFAINWNIRIDEIKTLTVLDFTLSEYSNFAKLPVSDKETIFGVFNK